MTSTLSHRFSDESAARSTRLLRRLSTSFVGLGGLSLMLAVSTFACSSDSGDGANGALSGDDTIAPTPSGDDGVSGGGDDGSSVSPPSDEQDPGKVTEKTEGEPEIVSWTSMSIKNGLFPTYLAANIANIGHLASNIVIKNPSSEKKRFILRASLQGYTKSETPVTVDLEAGQTGTFWADSSLDFEALSKLSSPVDSAITVTLTSTSGNLFFSVDRAVKVLPKNQVFWKDVFNNSTLGGKFPEGTMERIAVVGAMTTPHDKGGFIDKLLQEAAAENGGVLSGYQVIKSGMTLEQVDAAVGKQAEAIYKALKKRGMNYTSVTADFFASQSGQNVRFPGESLQAGTANCIDGSLVFASAFEALGIESDVIYVPGHAYVVFRMGPHGNDQLYNRGGFIETTVLSTQDYLGATKIGSENHNSRFSGKELFIPLWSVRQEYGYVPFPM